MTTTILRETVGSTPFTLNFVEKLDPVLYDEAIKSSEMVRQSYDPETQTSNISIYAGTTLSYDDSFSGLLGLSKDDTNQTDT